MKSSVETEMRGEGRAPLPPSGFRTRACDECGHDDFDHYEVFVCVRCGCVHRHEDDQTRTALIRAAFTDTEIGQLLKALDSHHAHVDTTEEIARVRILESAFRQAGRAKT